MSSASGPSGQLPDLLARSVAAAAAATSAVNAAFAAQQGYAARTAVAQSGPAVLPVTPLSPADWQVLVPLLAAIQGAEPRGRRKYIGRRLPLRIEPHGADVGFHLGPFNDTHIRMAAKTLYKLTIRCYGRHISGRNAPPATALATGLQMAWAAAAPGLEITGGLGEAAALRDLAVSDTVFVATMLGTVQHTSSCSVAGKRVFGLAARQNFNLAVALTELGLPPLAFRIARWRLNNLATFAVGVPLKAGRELFDALFPRYMPRPGITGPVDRVLARLRAAAAAPHEHPEGPIAESSVQLVGTMALALFFGLRLEDFAPPFRPPPPANPAPPDPVRLNALKSAIRQAVATASTNFLEQSILARAGQNPEGHSAWLLDHGMTLPHRHLCSDGTTTPLAIHDRSRRAYTAATEAGKLAAAATARAEGHRDHAALLHERSYTAGSQLAASLSETHAAAATAAASAARAASAELAKLAAQGLAAHVRGLRIRNGSMHATAIRTGCCTNFPALHAAAGRIARDRARASVASARAAARSLIDAEAAVAAAAANSDAELISRLAHAREAASRADRAVATLRIDTCPYCPHHSRDADTFAYTLEHIFVTCTAPAFALARHALFEAMSRALTLEGVSDSHAAIARTWLAEVQSAPGATYTHGIIYTLSQRRLESRGLAPLPQELSNAGVFAALALGAEGARGTDTVAGVPGCDTETSLLMAQLAGATFLQSMDATWNARNTAHGHLPQAPAQALPGAGADGSDGDTDSEDGDGAFVPATLDWAELDGSDVPDAEDAGSGDALPGELGAAAADDDEDRATRPGAGASSSPSRGTSSTSQRAAGAAADATQVRHGSPFWPARRHLTDAAAPTTPSSPTTTPSPAGAGHSPPVARRRRASEATAYPPRPGCHFSLAMGAASGPGDETSAGDNSGDIDTTSAPAADFEGPTAPYRRARGSREFGVRRLQLPSLIAGQIYIAGAIRTELRSSAPGGTLPASPSATAAAARGALMPGAVCAIGDGDVGDDTMFV